MTIEEFKEARRKGNGVRYIYIETEDYLLSETPDSIYYFCKKLINKLQSYDGDDEVIHRIEGPAIIDKMDFLFSAYVLEGVSMPQEDWEEERQGYLFDKQMTEVLE